jgi:hypothetical protein
VAEKGKKAKAVRKGKKAGEDDGWLGESQEVTGPKGKAREVEVPEEQVVGQLIIRHFILMPNQLTIYIPG